MTFPSPVGGTAFPSDFAPSIIFTILYGLLVPVVVYRMLHRRSRNTLLIGSMMFTIERVVIFSLRAVQSHNEGKRESKGLATYMQLTIGMGFISISQDLVNLIRCLMVNATYGSETYAQSPGASGSSRVPASMPSSESHRLNLIGGGATEDSGFLPDHPAQRFWSRRFADGANIAFVAAIAPGILANSHYSGGMDDDSKARKIMRLRYVSSAVALFLTLVLVLVAVWTRMKRPRIRKNATSLIISIAFLMSVTAVYRLSVMFHTTTSLTSTAPGSLNSRGAKATFYIFHMLPEWIATAALFCFNVREIVGTGPFGDYRWRDETPKEKEKRERKEAKRTEKDKERSMKRGAQLAA